MGIFICKSQSSPDKGSKKKEEVKPVFVPIDIIYPVAPK